MDDGLGDALRTNSSKALKLACPAGICVALYFALTTLPTYEHQRAITLVLVNFAIANLTLNLMLSNMSGRKFSVVLQPAICTLLVPLAAYYLARVSPNTEMLISKAMCVLAFCMFYGKVALVSIQWCDYAKTKFWVTDKSKWD